MEQLGNITLHLGDCMDVLKQLPDTNTGHTSLT